MSKSWGHTVRAMTPEEQAWADKEFAHERYPRTCSAGKCDGRPTFVTTYRYVTGRGGRTSWAQRNLCEDHAIAFASKHGVSAEVFA